MAYCLKLASTPSVGVASVRGDAVARGGSAQVLIPAKSADCGATGDTSAEVLTSDAGGAAAQRGARSKRLGSAIAVQRAVRLTSA